MKVDATEPSFLVRHWRGTLPLVASFWGVGIALPILFESTLSVVHLYDRTYGFGPRSFGASLLLVVAFAAVSTVWQVVGVWNSAATYVGKGGRKIFAILARLAMVIPCLRAVLIVASNQALLADGFRLAIWGDDTPPSVIEVSRAGDAVELSGGMPFGTTAAVRGALDANPSARVVELNSTGGRLQEGLKLHDLIVERRLGVHTSRSCESACALAFLGGSPRTLGPDARLGFHGIPIDGKGGERKKSAINLEEALASYGLPQPFVRKVISTPGSSMWYPSRDELLANRIISSPK